MAEKSDAHLAVSADRQSGSTEANTNQSRSRLKGVLLTAALALGLTTACDESGNEQDTSANVEGDGDGDAGENPEGGDGDETPIPDMGSGEEEMGDGDGDENPETGDGDGDGDTTETGDGDGETTETGDGDGEPTGDGDGDGDTEGDGDGDMEMPDAEINMESIQISCPQADGYYVCSKNQSQTFTFEAENLITWNIEIDNGTVGPLEEMGGKQYRFDFTPNNGYSTISITANDKPPVVINNIYAE